MRKGGIRESGEVGHQIPNHITLSALLRRLKHIFLQKITHVPDCLAAKLSTYSNNKKSEGRIIFYHMIYFCCTE